MAKSDYALCEVCDGKVFYDADDEVGDAAIFHRDCLTKRDAAVAAKALREAADEMDAVIMDGDVAEAAAPVPGEIGRSAVVARRDALHEDPSAWLRQEMEGRPRVQRNEGDQR